MHKPAPTTDGATDGSTDGATRDGATQQDKEATDAASSKKSVKYVNKMTVIYFTVI